MASKEDILAVVDKMQMLVHNIDTLFAKPVSHTSLSPATRRL
jgi:hypothetical protein